MEHQYHCHARIYLFRPDKLTLRRYSFYGTNRDGAGLITIIYLLFLTFNDVVYILNKTCNRLFSMKNFINRH